MLQVKTNFLTPGWDEWRKEFLEFAPAIQSSASADERGWVSVGERQNVAALVVTIEREKATLTTSGWAGGKGTEPGMWRYERKYATSDPTPEQVANDICTLLKLPPSQASRT
jgi:hypothetical protein